MASGGKGKKRKKRSAKRPPRDRPGMVGTIKRQRAEAREAVEQEEETARRLRGQLERQKAAIETDVEALPAELRDAVRDEVEAEIARTERSVSALEALAERNRADFARADVAAENYLRAHG